jgi:hypothetical protein
MAKMIAFEQEAREAIRRGVSKLARSGESDTRPEGPQRDSSEELRQPRPSPKTASAVAKEIESRRRLREHGRSAWFAKSPARPAMWPATEPPPPPSWRKQSSTRASRPSLPVLTRSR